MIVLFQPQEDDALKNQVFRVFSVFFCEYRNHVILRLIERERKCMYIHVLAHTCVREQMPYIVDFSILAKERDRRSGQKRQEH